MKNMENYKLWILNGATIGVTSIDVENALKLILLVLTIGYTAWKWRRDYKSKKE